MSAADEVSASGLEQRGKGRGEWGGEESPQEIEQWSEGQDAIGLEATPLEHGKSLVDCAHGRLADET